MGNFSRSPQAELTSALALDYSRVRFQQGKPALDRELNLAADLASPQRLAAQYVGSGIAGSGNDFRITNLNVGGNDFAIGAGRCLVNGLEAVLRADTTYATQPNRANVAPLPAGSSNVYLRVFEREVTSAEDPALANAGDVTFETAVRNKVEWEVVVSVPQITTPDVMLLAVITTAPPAIVDQRRLNVSVGAARDELMNARGASQTLATRLSAALAPNGALLANAVGTAQIAAQAVTQDKIAAGAVAAAQLKLVPRFTGTAAVPGNGEQRITAFNGPRHATLFVSITITGAIGSVTWSEFATLIPILGVPPPPPLFQRGVRIQNTGANAVVADVQIFELQAV
jgi:hypothetical protein